MYVCILYICISYMYICICSVNRVWDVFTVNLSLCPFTLFFSFQACNESTYQEVVRATCGKVTGILCEVAIAVYTFGTCIAFFIVIGDQLDRCEYNHSEATNIPQLGANVWFWWAEIHTYTRGDALITHSIGHLWQPIIWMMADDVVWVFSLVTQQRWF